MAYTQANMSFSAFRTGCFFLKKKNHKEIKGKVQYSAGMGDNFGGMFLRGALGFRLPITSTGPRFIVFLVSSKVIAHRAVSLK